MSKERIGKFERWILTHCYLKTVKGELPPNWKYPRCYENTEVTKGVLWKSEVLLNHFTELKLSQRKADDISREKFEDTREYRKALVSFARVINRLDKKGYILFWVDKHTKSLRAISLKEAGIKKAESILKVNS